MQKLSRLGTLALLRAALVLGAPVLLLAGCTPAAAERPEPDPTRYAAVPGFDTRE